LITATDHAAEGFYILARQPDGSWSYSANLGRDFNAEVQSYVLLMKGARGAGGVQVNGSNNSFEEGMRSIATQAEMNGLRGNASHALFKAVVRSVDLYSAGAPRAFHQEYVRLHFGVEVPAKIGTVAPASIRLPGKDVKALRGMVGGGDQGTSSEREVTVSQSIVVLIGVRRRSVGSRDAAFRQDGRIRRTW